MKQTTNNKFTQYSHEFLFTYDNLDSIINRDELVLVLIVQLGDFCQYHRNKLLQCNGDNSIASYVAEYVLHAATTSQCWETKTATISVILLEHCQYNCVSLPLPQGQCCKKSFNRIDEDKRSQNYATLSRDTRGGCSTNLCH